MSTLAPYAIQGRVSTRKVQRRATRFILQESSLPYKERLICLNLLPLSYWLELLDILFFVKCLQDPPPNLNILEYVSFAEHSTRAASNKKLAYKFHRTSAGRHFYFARIVGLWNALPGIDLEISYSRIKAILEEFFWNRFLRSFDESNHCTYNICCPCTNCHLTRS